MGDKGKKDKGKLEKQKKAKLTQKEKPRRTKEAQGCFSESELWFDKRQPSD